ncbi:MAG: SPFH domain-containing protein, partial [Acidimicrobiales bacterium]|nr:SPFH domain-containing protein [Acidimicrobiales bacterium]
MSVVLGAIVLLAIAVLVLVTSFRSIGPSEIGLVTKRVGRKLKADQIVALNGEAGFQADLLMPGLRFKLWPIFGVKRHDWVQVAPDHIGLVIAQVGAPLPTGAKSGYYKASFGNFADIRTFLADGGQRGVQRPVLPPGTTAPIHPVGFIVVTSDQVFGEVISDSASKAIDLIDPSGLQVVRITPQGDKDIVGVVNALEGPPAFGIASRIGGFDDVAAMEKSGKGSAGGIIQAVLRTKNDLHDNYQDYQAFLEAGGCIGLQHDPLLYGSYLLNPLLVQVELRDMLVVRQGEVAVMKSYVGLPTEDTSGEEFKFGSIVAPGHQGIWSEPLRTGKYTLNPRIYEAEIVPTSILTLNWSAATSEAHSLDERLDRIEAKSKEAFTFSIDLQVQIHVPDTRAPKVISMVGTMQNLVNEVLHSAVGNYFRNKLQTLGATEFIEKRDEVQHAAEGYIRQYLARYEVETRGVYIQDVAFPPDLVEVLTSREIAAQEKATFAQQRVAQEARVSLEQQKGVADMQGRLAQANVSIDIERANAQAARARAQGEADVITTTGRAEATRKQAIGQAEAVAEQALGLARAKGFSAQRRAIGSAETAMVAALREVSAGGVKIVPDIQVGDDSGGVIGGLGALLMRSLSNNNSKPPVDEEGFEDEEFEGVEPLEEWVPTPVATEAPPAPPSSYGFTSLPAVSTLEPVTAGVVVAGEPAEEAPVEEGAVEAVATEYWTRPE